MRIYVHGGRNYRDVRELKKSGKVVPDRAVCGAWRPTNRRGADEPKGEGLVHGAAMFRERLNRRSDMTERGSGHAPAGHQPGDSHDGGKTENDGIRI